MFQFAFNFAKSQLFGLDFFHVCCLPQAKCFLGKLQQNGSVISQHRARGKTYFVPVTDYTYEKSYLGDPVMALHTGKGIWYLSGQNWASCCPCVILSGSATLQASQKPQFVQAQRRLSRVWKLYPVCFIHEPGPWQKEGRSLSWIRGWGEMMDKLWGDCLPRLWVPRTFQLTKDGSLPNSHCWRSRPTKPYLILTFYLLTCLASASVKQSRTYLPLMVVNYCYKNTKEMQLSLKPKRVTCPCGTRSGPLSLTSSAKPTRFRRFPSRDGSRAKLAQRNLPLMPLWLP